MSGTVSAPSYTDYQEPVQYALNSKIMVAAIIVLFLVVLFILSLHIYAKWFWRNSSLAARRTASWRRRHRLEFTGDEPFLVSGGRGLDKAVIDSLPTFMYQAPQADEAVMECAVCLSEFQEDEKGRLLPKCNHSFHTECIDMWFHSHSTCPLCRTVVAPGASPDAQQQQNASGQPPSPFYLPQSWADSQSMEQRAMAMEAGDAAAVVSGPSQTEEGLPGVPYPTNVLFWGDHNQVSSRFSSPRFGRDYSSTRSLPQITIEIPRRADNLASPRCLSLSLPRCSPPEEQACSSPLKSPSLRVSIKRLLSREKRVFPSNQEGGEIDQDTTPSPV